MPRCKFEETETDGEWVCTVCDVKTPEGRCYISAPIRPCPAKKPRQMPPAKEMAWNLAEALGAFVVSGCDVVDKEEYERRLAICDTCEDRYHRRCRLCGCYLPVKAGAKVWKCPAGKWNQELEKNN